MMYKHTENPNGKYHSIAYMCKETNISRTTLMRLAAEAEALVQIGTRNKKIDAEKFYKYMDEVCSIHE